MKRYMSLDIGDRTIGIAVSDLLGLTAQGVETIRRKSLADDLKRLGELMDQYETKSLVSGLPKNMDGTEGDRCAIVKEFMAEVKKAYPEVEVFSGMSASRRSRRRARSSRPMSRAASARRSLTRWRLSSSCRAFWTASVDKPSRDTIK